MPQFFYLLGAVNLLLAAFMMWQFNPGLGILLVSPALVCFAAGYVISLLMQIRDNTIPLLRLAQSQTSAPSSATATEGDDEIVDRGRYMNRDYVVYRSGRASIQSLTGSEWKVFGSLEEMKDYIS